MINWQSTAWSTSLKSSWVLPTMSWWCRSCWLITTDGEVRWQQSLLILKPECPLFLGSFPFYFIKFKKANNKATNPSPSSQFTNGTKLSVSCFWEQNLEIRRCYMLRHSLNFWTLLSTLNEYVTRQLKMRWRGEKGTFSNLKKNTDVRINLRFRTK